MSSNIHTSATANYEAVHPIDVSENYSSSKMLIILFKYKQYVFMLTILLANLLILYNVIPKW